MAKKTNNAEIHPIHKLMSINIIRLRKKSGITQMELSRKTGLTYNFINELENGKKGVSAETIAKICNALNAEPFQLFMPLDFQVNDLQKNLKDYKEKMAGIIKELDKIIEYGIFM